ncbi:leucine-zipper-like transcriptional regulator 1 [Argopecten irradians]|uniref:leucine-zipper-like transcriptional regulator 1 n=1 Tax=Argopecten irradians TaxID=31199 RepID=UPI003710640C
MASGPPSLDGRKTIQESLEFLFLTGTDCDVIFLVGEPRTRISAHKLILSCRSRVFSVMFEGSLKEKGDIVITDAPPDIFHLFIRYLYTDKIQMTGVDQVAVLLYLSKKYWIDTLADDCENYLSGAISSENVFTILDYAILFDIESVQIKCLGHIHKDFMQEIGLPDLESSDYPFVAQMFKVYSEKAGKGKEKHSILHTWLNDAKQVHGEKEMLPYRRHTARNKTLIECLKNLLDYCCRGDVVFMVGGYLEPIHAHRLILISRSPVFYAMFEGDSAGEREIILPEAFPSVFYLFLRYLYTDVTVLRGRNSEAVQDLARTYHVDSYRKKMCAEIKRGLVIRHDGWQPVKGRHDNRSGGGTDKDGHDQQKGSTRI